MTFDPAVLLLGFGFLWMIVACVLGLIQGAGHDTHLERLDQYAEAGELANYHREVTAYRRRTTTHAHSMLFPVIAILVALSLPYSGYTGTLATVLTGGLIAATIIWTIGGVLNLRAVMGLGDLLLLAAITTNAAGLLGAW